MRNAPRISVTSYWLDGSMKPIHASIVPFIRDLEVNQVGVAGQRLLEALNQNGVNTLHATSLTQLAERLRHPASTSLEDLVELAKTEARWTSLVVVALAPEITEAIARSGGRWLTQARFGDLCLGARAALEDDTTDRFNLAAGIVSEARKLSRAETSHRHLTLHWTPAMDVEAPSFEEDSRIEALRHAIDTGIVTAAELELLVATRVRGVSLHDFADREGVSYSAIRMRRLRIENKLRVFITNEVNR